MHPNVENWIESTGSRSNSSGKYPRILNSADSHRDPNMMTETQCEPEQCTGIIIVMSMYNDIVWRAKGNEEMCIANFKIVPNYAKIFAHGH